MSHYTATITHYKNQPIGIGLANDPKNGLIISSIDEEGALSKSCLKSGMKLRTINNIDVSCLSSKEAVKVLKEAEGKLVLSAEVVVPADITFVADIHYRRQDGVIMHGMMRNDIENATPTIFKEAGVPAELFSRIYKLIESDLLPPAASLRIHEKAFEREFEHYVWDQMSFEAAAASMSRPLLKKFYEMTLKSSHLERNCDLKAMEVVMKVNAMLAKYNLMATVALEPISNGKQSNKARNKYERLNVVGLSFHKME